VATEPNVSAIPPDSTQVPAIENELPAYRAISAQAISSLLFGVLSILSLASPMFLACAAIAVLLGILADRRIQRLPDVLTGRRFAHAGIVLGLVFGLGSFTAARVQDYLRSSSATRFAKRYVEILKNEPMENGLWYRRPPDGRKGKTPAQLLGELKAAAKDPQMVKMETGVFEQIKDRLAGAPGEDIHFERIETHGYEGLDEYAAILLELHGPGSKHYPDKQQYALLVVKARPAKGKYDWWVSELRFPYQPSTYKPAPKQVDDGHGHGHSH
jgi:hypothetical protein